MNAVVLSVDGAMLRGGGDVASVFASQFPFANLFEPSDGDPIPLMICPKLPELLTWEYACWKASTYLEIRFNPADPPILLVFRVLQAISTRTGVPIPRDPALLPRFFESFPTEVLRVTARDDNNHLRDQWLLPQQDIRQLEALFQREVSNFAGPFGQQPQINVSLTEFVQVLLIAASETDICQHGLDPLLYALQRPVYPFGCGGRLRWRWSPFDGPLTILETIVYRKFHPQTEDEAAVYASLGIELNPDRPPLGLLSHLAACVSEATGTVAPVQTPVELFRYLRAQTDAVAEAIGADGSELPRELPWLFWRLWLIRTLRAQETQLNRS
jgi:hypothetical protein